MRASSLHTLEQTAILLGWSTHTVRTYTKIAGIVPASSGHYRGRCLYSEADIETLRRIRSERDPRSVTTRPATADTSALEARVAELERQVAALLARYDDNSAPHVYSTVYAPPKRVTATTASYKHNPARPSIPAGKMSLPMWVKLHPVKQGTVEHWRDVGKLPMERGKWMEGNTRIDYVMDAEGRRVAHQLAHLPWPCERCMLDEEQEETNETPHTLEP